ncbi:Peptidase A22, presenilin signal peptide domain-containing protein [Paramicrosporidium saccamoebae]|uniref:Peptidase A22, presenilin signal peptide domain-containing protein n=1 Tax=Paramicrosporidium saccamoebae TaxID=1246581 RepID=A0A2H9TLA5_9FUNG|nr:Peptidase A22, presenilin signal peptide domain-containing protein [Paramicrosporidium saccamoebae]
MPPNDWFWPSDDLVQLGELREMVVQLPFDPIFIAYAGLMTMAVVPIYFGSKLSVEESESDAYWFPVIGSCVLFGFYLLFNYFSKEYINYLLTAYFGAFGAFSVAKMLVGMASMALPKKWYMFDYYHVVVERKKDGKLVMVNGSLIGILLDTKLTWLHGAMGVVSLALTAYYVYTKNWIASNIFGEAFSISAISLIQLDTFVTGMILLAGLFVYDIFWVFGTDVMVSVAKSFDVPVKVLFPRDIISSPNSGFSMLGLGDIVIPGVFIALCLKFDHHLIASKRIAKNRSPYFTTALVFYILGLLTTMAVMHIYKAAQPALLYLSPAGILSVLLTAIVRGELKEIFAFTTEPAAVEEEVYDEEESDDDGTSKIASKGGRSSPAKRRAKKD